MAGDLEMVTVFRSADDDAEADAKTIGEMLTAEGIHAVVLDDSAPGVPSGAWEVQTPAVDASRAEQIIAEASLPDEELTDVNDSAALDMVAVFRARSSVTAEMEAMAIKGMLEAAGIAAIIVGDSVLPNLPFEVRVAKDKEAEANEVIRRAEEIGPEAAEEEETSSEAPLNP
jgi:hypothetical protein